VEHSQDIHILPFQPQHQPEAKALILAGLEEHWGVLIPGKNPDLDNISLSYAKALFLVALQGEKLIGTGALAPKSDDTAEIVRMSVSSTMRRRGIGKKILNALCLHAKAEGYKRVILETTETWQDAIEFYRQFGFKITHHLDGDVYLALDLSE
jgi:ribosomal protein S18 acetylase RimI-like enzyme